jgi:hypothetical protein
MILVELAGAGGVGKSTLAPLIARRLKEVLGAENVAALPENGVGRKRRQWTRVRRWSWITMHPSALLVARKACLPEVKTSRFSSWVRIFSTLGIGRLLLRRGIKVVLIDQGILRLPLLPAHVDMLPSALLPDLVLHVVADPATIELRRIWREKTKHRRYQEGFRMMRAQESLHLLARLPSPELREAMIQFGRQFCDPPFTVDEIDELLRQSQTVEQPASGKGRIGRCEPDICERIRLRGILWREIDNSQPDSLDAVVERCVQEIVTACEASGKR